MKAVQVHETGGPEKQIYEEPPAPSPGANQALVKIDSIGLNYSV
jgi:NADPH:quinone reductase